MGLRGVVLMVLVAAGLPAAAQWQATAAAPREGLPDVEVVLGYTADYLPALNTPVTLRARSGERPFDGYIGYHTAAGGRKAFEMPVAARAELRPHSQWTFSTWIRLPMGTHGWDWRIGNRELVIEWRDRGRHVLAERSIGAPPWTETLRPLHVSDDNVSSLSDQPQWYGGFSMVALPQAQWLELPRGVRDAIFRSAVRVVFTVPGRPLPPPDPEYFAVRIAPQRVSPLSPVPQVLQAARRPLPAAGEIFREYRTAVFFTLFAALSIAAWLLLRRRPRALVFAAMGAVALLAVGWRNAIRPAAQHRNEWLWIAAPGVVDRISSGALTDAGGGRVLAEPVREGDDLEVRTSHTPPGFGELYFGGSGWPMPRRAVIRREAGTPATLRVRSQDRTRLVLEYDSTIPVDYVAACWKRNGLTYYGEARAGSRRGVAAIRHLHRAWPSLEEMLYDDALGHTWLHTRPGLYLIHLERDRTVVIAQRGNP